MQFENTNISGAQINHYLRRGRLERSLALRALIKAGLEGIARSYRAMAGQEDRHGVVGDREACAH